MHAIEVSAYGGPEVLLLKNLPDPAPAEHEMVIDVAAVGVNYFDVYQRSGLYPVSLPYVPGREGAGVVSAVGSDAGEFKVGDRVAWGTGIGSYGERVAVAACDVLAVPDGVSLETAAAVMLQGMTAHYLAISAFPLQEGSRCLIHAGAGGTGLLLIQIAKQRGAEVFTTVGNAAKAELALAAGADHAVIYNETNFAEAIEEIAGPQCLDVVYDGVGASVFEDGLKMLRPRGLMVSFGNASGPVPPVAPLALGTKSLFLTRPRLDDYVADREELEWRAEDLFSWIASGELNVRVGLELPLADAAEAHRRLEGRETTGKILLRTKG